MKMVLFKWEEQMKLLDLFSGIGGFALAATWTCGTFIIPACAVNAPHRRDRVWIIAHFGGFRKLLDQCQSSEKPSLGRHFGSLFNWNNVQIEWKREIFRRSSLLPPRICGVDDGIPQKLDRVRALGNAIVPQVAHQLMLMIKYIDEHCTEVEDQNAISLQHPKENTIIHCTIKDYL